MRAFILCSTMRFYVSCIVAFGLCCFTQLGNAKDFNIVFSADMPAISDRESGRYAELASFIKQEREKDKDMFFIYGGGSLGPSAMSGFDRGSHIIDILNSIEPDAMGITKREFSYREDELSARAYEAAFPLISSNTADKRIGDGLEGLVDSVIIEKSDKKLGFISILSERVISEYLLEYTNILDPKSIVKQQASYLRNQGADIIVLHLSFPFDFVGDFLNRNIVDLAFLSDTRIRESTAPSYFSHERFFHLNSAGHAIVSVVDTGSKLRVKESVDVDLLTFSKSKNIQLQVDAYQLRVDRLLNQQIGYWRNAYSTIRADVRTKENAFGNFVVDAMKQATKADIAFLNGGSFRGDVNYAAQSVITRKQIATELPFRSRLVVIRVTGEELLQALESGLSEFESYQGRFPQIAGMKVTFDSDNAVGERVISVSVKGKALDMDKQYRLATSDYIASGGDGYSILASIEKSKEDVVSPILISDLVIRNIRSKKGVDNTTDGRLVNLSGGK
ncbi:bifunctional metallophosphatase/5'-nucleotidase [Agaribacter marinus]|uniref:Multifunctional 2',3'-cyclic-nucleotide 2'-phosphodiesterase/5'-nucleotidase/3'-nucleotidase n=1 Tax=Agaribacter marinus TaxID=1431249 RepID=A0AA37SZ27_9ALTE|nr:5'-nucleotidase C-terminal domain-containing protein [Agaribacter marinus]GLR69203.1 multifunctional 2',3'-cyclic-nucleotide 2'-phosphodiesterase/5'-nucleotidase/3'-nucleotidase [Agaribacter marinus]